ncbi:MAG: hypothetical protein WDM92_15080 [Caulobacteraceae bacterium]
MFLELDGVLTPQELQRLRALGKTGSVRRGPALQPQFQGQEQPADRHADPGYAEASKMMAAALQRHEGFRAFTYARVMAPRRCWPSTRPACPTACTTTPRSCRSGSGRCALPVVHHLRRLAAGL